MRLASLVFVIALFAGPGCASSARADVTVVVSSSYTDDDTAPRIQHKAAALADGSIMVTGGLGLTLLPPSLFSRDAVSFFDPVTEQFASTFQPGNGQPPTNPSLNIARSYHRQVTLNDGRALITGGRTGATGTNAGAATASVELFDPYTGEFTLIDDMAHARADHSATLLPDGRVLVAGGDAAGTWQLFDPESDSWSAAQPLQRTRTAHAAVLLDDSGARGSTGRVLLIGGLGNGAATMEIIDVAALQSTLLISTLDAGLDDLAAVQVDDGRVFIVGGQFTSTGDTTDACAWLDPEADTIVMAPAVPDRAGGIADHQLLRAGRLLVVLGGEQQVAGADTELDTLAVFDPLINSWVYSGTMQQPHDDAPAVVLADGRVLVVGGGVPLFGQEFPDAGCELVTIECLADGDVTADCMVDLGDLLTVIANWGCSGEAMRGCSCAGDATGDCAVDLADLLSVIANWGT